MSNHEENGWKKVLHGEIDVSRCRMRGGEARHRDNQVPGLGSRRAGHAMRGPGQAPGRTPIVASGEYSDVRGTEVAEFAGGRTNGKAPRDGGRHGRRHEDERRSGVRAARGT